MLGELVSDVSGCAGSFNELQLRNNSQTEYWERP